MRSILLDSRTQPVENMCLNPSFERVVAGTSVVFRNLALNPTAAAVGNSYRVNNASTHEIKTGVPVPAPHPEGLTTTSSGRPLDQAATAYVYSAYNIDGLLVTGPSRIVGAWFYVDADNMSGAIASTTGGAAKYTNLPKKKWTFISGFIAAGNHAMALIRTTTGVSLSASAIGYVTGVTALTDREPTHSIWGDRNDNSGVSYAWEGTPNNSPSVAKANLAEFRKNFAKNPRGAVSTNGWDFQLGTGESSSLNGRGAIRAVAGGANLALLNVGDLDGTKRYAWKARVAAANESAVGKQVRAMTYNPFDSSEMPGTSSGVVTLGSVGEEIDIICPASPEPGNTTLLRAYFVKVTLNAPWETGVGAIHITDVLFMEVSSAGETVATVPYFDGSTSLDPDLVPAWTGTPHMSVSVLQYVRLANISGSAGILAQSRDWSMNGFSSGRLSSRYPTRGSVYADVASNQAPRGLKAGRTYTVMVYARLKNPRNALAKVSLAYYSNETGANVWQYSEAPSQEGVYLLRLVVTIPTDSTKLWAIRLYNGGNTTDPDVWFDSMSIVEGVYTGPYLDGDSPNSIWRGTPHNSTSIGYPSSA